MKKSRGKEEKRVNAEGFYVVGKVIPSYLEHGASVGFGP